jgi:hypothetical protein
MIVPVIVSIRAHVSRAALIPSQGRNPSSALCCLQGQCVGYQHIQTSDRMICTQTCQTHRRVSGGVTWICSNIDYFATGLRYGDVYASSRMILIAADVMLGVNMVFVYFLVLHAISLFMELS